MIVVGTFMRRALRRFCAISALCMFFASSAAATQLHPWSLDYTFSPHLDSAASWLDVEVRFPNSASGTTLVDIPSSFASAQNLESDIVDLRPLSPQTAIANTGDPSVKRITGPPGADVNIAYRVIKNWNGPLTHKTGNYFRALIEKDYTLFLGPNALLLPEWNPSLPHSVSLHWRLPESPGRFGDSYGIGEPNQRVVTSLYDLSNAMFFAGDFRRFDISVGGKSVDALVRGDWPFDDRTFATAVQRIVATERGFWRDNAFPIFTILLTPDDEPLGTGGGSAYSNAFVLYEPARSPIDFEFYHALAHEYFHTWNPGKIGALPGNAELVAWFYEGFTEFYTVQMILRSGLMTPAEYVREVARKDRRYEAFPNRNAPNSALKGNAFTQDFYDLPYLRGERLARYWNQAICSRSDGKASLDSFMRALFIADEPRPLISDVYIEHTLRDFLGTQAETDTRLFALEGKTIPRSTPMVGCTIIKDGQRAFR